MATPRTIKKQAQTPVQYGEMRPLLADWRRHLRAENKAPATIESYARVGTAFCDYLDEAGMPTTAAAITREHVESFLGDLLDRVSAATTAKHYRSLQQLFRWLESDGEITASPMGRMKPPKVPEQPVPIMSDDEVSRLFAACKGAGFEPVRDLAILRMLWDCGIRASELVTMTVDSVDLDLDLIEVMGKGRRARTVTMSNRTASALGKYLRRGRSSHPLASKTDALWLGRKGALTDSGLRQLLERRAADAGVENVHPHRFRHTAAHAWLAAGGQEQDLQRRMGWQSPQMVIRYGASAGVERSHAAARRLAIGDRL